MTPCWFSNSSRRRRDGGSLCPHDGRALALPGRGVRERGALLERDGRPSCAAGFPGFPDKPVLPARVALPGVPRQLSPVSYPLPTVHCPLSTAHCPLSTVHCPLSCPLNARTIPPRRAAG